MKQQANEQQWEGSQEPSKEFLEATATLDEDEQVTPPVSAKAKLTELRRRIEERLDEKRIAHEHDYLEMEDWADSLQ